MSNEKERYRPMMGKNGKSIARHLSKYFRSWSPQLALTRAEKQLNQRDRNPLRKNKDTRKKTLQLRKNVES
jgi:hypothetical protein